MSYLAVGINHRSAPSETLEGVTLDVDQAAKLLVELSRHEVVNEAVVLATCNRTEIYVHAERFHDGFRVCCDALALVAGSDETLLSEHLYVHHAAEAVEHLFRVAAGLDSVVLGEHEILGQVRTSWETALREGAAGPLLRPVFEHALRAGRRVRSETSIGKRTASLAHSAVDLAEERVPTLADARVLVVGTGELGASVAEAFARKGVADMRFCNRTERRAADLAARLGGRVGSMESVAEYVRAADVVISATHSSTPVIDAAMFTSPAGAVSPTLVMDLAVPRDVAPDVLTLASVDLLLLADLQAFANANLAERRAAADDARALLDEEMARYRRAIGAQEIDPLLAALYRDAESARQVELARIRRYHPELDDAQWAAIEAATVAVTKRLLHDPSSAIRRSAGTHRGDRLVEAVRELFDLS